MKILIIQNKEEILNPMLQLNENHIQQITQQFPNVEVAVIDDVKEQVDSKIEETKIILTLCLHNIDFQKAKNLKWVHVTAAGVDKLPETILKSNILITNSSGVHPIPIAEHVFAFMLIFERKINIAMKNQFVRDWVRDYKIQTVSELHRKTIGIIGLGRIGRKIAQLAKAFNMKVLAVVRNPREKEDNVDELYASKELDKILEQSDYVICCLPLTKETYHLFDYEKFKKMKPSAYFINIGRGKIVNEQDLIRALKDKVIAGAGLDVFEEEPLPTNSELWNLENVIITPHYSGWTPYYMDRVVDIFCENLRAFLENRRMPNLIGKERGY